MKGPKTLLAEALAEALDEFFVVDQTAMETNLLHDAAVKLRNTELKPRNGLAINSAVTASVRGVVQYVAFEWHWGKSSKDGGSDWVKDVTLTLEGLDFTVSLEKKDPSEQQQQEEGSATETSSQQQQQQQQPKKEASTGGLSEYVQEQIERIMDTLTLAVNDVVLNVELPDGSKLELGGNGVEISSMGRPKQEGLPLLQDFCIKRLHSNVISPDGVSFPFLEEISYKAKTERIFGNRFLSRMDRGVEVVGESSDNGVVVHAGEMQIQTISSLVGMLVEPSSPSSIFESDEGIEVVGLEESRHSETSENCEKEEAEGLPSYMQLPLAGVSLVLPNEAKVSLSNIILKYQMDGTIFSVEGKQGIAVDGHPVLALGETSIWITDLIKSEFRVEDTAVTDESQSALDEDEDEVVVFIHARSSEMTKLSGGISDALGIHQRLHKLDDKEEIQPVPQAATARSEPPSSWSFHLPGKIGCLWEQGESNIAFTLKNVEVNLDTMSMKVATIDHFQYPGMLRLAEPIDDTSFTYDGSAVSAIFQDVVVVLSQNHASDLSPDEERERILEHESSSVESKESSGDSSGYALPFGIHFTVSKFLAFKSDAKSVHTTMDKLELQLDPASKDDKNDDRTCVTMSVRELNHDMLRLKEQVLVATFVLFSDWETISSFHFGAKEIYVAAGYSLREWKALLPKKKMKRIEKTIRLPYAHVNKLKVIVIVKGVIGVKDSVLQVDPFNGKKMTSSEDMIRFYNKKVTEQVPGMIVNAQVLGTNVGDNVVSNYGGAVIGNLVGGAGVGGLLSVAAFDGVRNTIKEGKVSRGVEETDKWQVSDIARGLQHAAARATREGAAKRGKGQDDNGDPIDWALGASADATKYAGENKARLAGAGAGAMGFGYGLALGGPIGAIVGTIVASAATQKTVETIDDATRKEGIGEGTFTVRDINFDLKAPHDEPLFSGILLKRRDFVTWDWRSHYFVLAKGTLKYYTMSRKPPRGQKEDKNALFFDSSKGSRKSLNFVNHYVGNDVSLSRPKHNLFVFTINSLEQAEPLWVLGASSEAARSEWVSKISEAMASHNDARLSRVSLRSSATLDVAKRQSVRHSLPPELADLIDY